MGKKYSIKRDPTFVAPVELPVPGGSVVSVDFTFNYKDRDEINQFEVDRLKFFGDLEQKAISGEIEPEHLHPSVLEYEFQQLKKIVSGWDMEEEFNDENLRHFVKSSGPMVASVINSYLKSYEKAKQGN